MSSDIDTLCEMGFPRNRAEKAMAKTNHSGVQNAMDWLFAHSDDPDIDDPFEAPKGHTLQDESPSPTVAESGSENSGAAVEQARSLKCDDCGKLLKSELDAQAHAARTQHSNFSESTEEIKPLTEEEKKEQLQRLQERLKQRRMEKEEIEKKDQVSREKMRRATGKEMVSAKAKMEELEMKKAMEQRKREKQEERLAKQKVKEEIERDRRERASKFAKGGSGEQAAVSSKPPGGAAVASPAEQPKKEYDTCRIQIRLTNGQALTHTFGAKEQMAAVRLYITLNRTDGDMPFTLMTSFPRKVFTEEDMEKPLYDLGLVPSAVLIVTKAT